MGQMEFKDNKMEVEKANNKKLLEDVRFLVVSLRLIHIRPVVICSRVSVPT